MNNLDCNLVFVIPVSDYNKMASKPAKEDSDKNTTKSKAAKLIRIPTKCDAFDADFAGQILEDWFRKHHDVGLDSVDIK